ncbi:MAG TPA: ChbG/HpnK family deacetylase [Candidatus Cryosericum sp.]|nr:ChbG/HpnK family deacetylase [Candidatus Cryosericum sp.]
MRKHLIVNGDDFGASSGVNRGILEAHRHGILTSTSLLVTAPAAEEAARMSRAVPALSVGLHVDLGDALQHWSPASAARLRGVLAAQLARFERLMGRPPTHLDSHHDTHRDPRTTTLFLETARQHGLPLRGHSPVRPYSSFYGQWGGFTHVEQIGPENLARILEKDIDGGITELICHPGYVGTDLSSSYRAEREVELRTLCDPTIRRVLDRCGVRLLSHNGLACLKEIDA